MVNEIVHIQVGGCGNHIGNAFWEVVCKEHRINPQTGVFEGDQKENDSPLELQRIGTYFDEAGETNSLRYAPRACLIDLDPSTADLNQTSATSALYKPDNQIYGDGDCGGIWPEGHYEKGADTIDKCMDGIRKQIEKCHHLQGFQFTHGISGGSGGGMGTYLAVKIGDSFPDKSLLTFSVFPSSNPDFARSKYDIPSATLTLHQLLETSFNSNLTFILDNDALTNIVAQHQKSAPLFKDLNRVIATTMANVTASLRWPSEMNGELNSMCINLVPFPRLHFCLMSCAPVYAAADMDVNGVCKSLWNSNNWSVNVPHDSGKYMASCLHFRGGNMQQLNFSKVGHYQRTIDAIILLKGWVQHDCDTYQAIPAPIFELCANFVEENFVKFLQECNMPMYEFEWEIERMLTVAPERFITWIPDSTQSQLIRGNTALYANDELQYVQGNGVMVANHTGIGKVFDNICKALKRMSAQNAAQLGNSLSGGQLSGEMEMLEADKNVRDLVVEYQDKEDAIVNLDDDDDDDSEEDDSEEEDDDEDGDF